MGLSLSLSANIDGAMFERNASSITRYSFAYDGCCRSRTSSSSSGLVVPNICWTTPAGSACVLLVKPDDIGEGLIVVVPPIFRAFKRCCGRGKDTALAGYGEWDIALGLDTGTEFRTCCCCVAGTCVGDGGGDGDICNIFWLSLLIFCHG